MVLWLELVYGIKKIYCCMLIYRVREEGERERSRGVKEKLLSFIIVGGYFIL